MVVDLFYAFLWYVLRIPSVVLIDNDGAMHVRKVSLSGAGATRFWTAVRVGMGVRTVILKPDGKLDNGCYCKEWRPAYPKDWTPA